MNKEPQPGRRRFLKHGLGVVGVAALTSAGLAAVLNWGSIRGSIG